MEKLPKSSIDVILSNQIDLDKFDAWAKVTGNDYDRIWWYKIQVIPYHLYEQFLSFCVKNKIDCYTKTDAVDTTNAVWPFDK